MSLRAPAQLYLRCGEASIQQLVQPLAVAVGEARLVRVPDERVRLACGTHAAMRRGLSFVVLESRRPFLCTERGDWLEPYMGWRVLIAPATPLLRGLI